MRFKQGRPRKLDKKYRNYTPEQLDNAYKAVKSQGLPVLRAAKKYGVPENTLRDRVKGRIDHDNAKLGGDTMFSREEEETLIEHLKVMCELGYGYSNVQLQHTAGELAYDLGKKKHNRPMSNCWLYGFMKRWQTQITSLKPQKLDSNRARSTTPENVNNYFQNMKDIFDKYDLHSKPQNIYNADETGLQPDHRPPNVIAPVNSKPQSITSPRTASTTLIGCANAIGNHLPPFFVFKGSRFMPDLMKGASSGAGYAMSKTGWSNGAIFTQYLKEHFYPHVKGQTEGNNYVLLVYDGHSAHVNREIINWARENHIILVVLPAHSSHLLQPLDVSIFGPFKHFFYTECDLYMKKNIGQNITRYEICGLACKAYSKAITPINIMSGFAKTGIYPLDSNVVPAEKLYPCENFREDQPVQKIKAIKSGKQAVEEFLIKKSEKISEKKQEDSSQCEHCKQKNTETKPKSKPNAGGKVITDDNFYIEITEYENNKESNKKEKVTKKQQNLQQKPKKQKIDSCRPHTDQSPLPSTSKLQVQIDLSEEEISSEDDAEDDVCCVCGKFYVPRLNGFPDLKIVNWGCCDKCGHWVHLRFCTDVHVLRRHSTFLCPHCLE